MKSKADKDIYILGDSADAMDMLKVRFQQILKQK